MRNNNLHFDRISMFKQIMLWFFKYILPDFFPFLSTSFFKLEWKKNTGLKFWWLDGDWNWSSHDFFCNWLHKLKLFRITFNVATKNIFILCIICHLKTLVHVYFCYFSNHVFPTRIPPDACLIRNKFPPIC